MQTTAYLLLCHIIHWLDKPNENDHIIKGNRVHKELYKESEWIEDSPKSCCIQIYNKVEIKFKFKIISVCR